MVERAINHHGFPYGRRNHGHGLAIGKPVNLDGCKGRTETHSQTAAGVGFIRKGGDAESHQAPSTMKPLASPAASTAKLKSEGSSPWMR